MRTIGIDLAWFGVGVWVLSGGGCGGSPGAETTDSEASSTGGGPMVSTGMISATSSPGSGSGSGSSADSGTPTGTADTTAGSSTGVDFIRDPTVGGCGETDSVGGSTVECSVWDQDCCSGEKCMPWANDGGAVANATRCSPIDPEGGAPGEPCTVMGGPVSGLDDCDATSYCFDVDPDTLMGTCVAFCQGEEQAPECRKGTECFAFNDGVVPVCLALCDPLADDCPEGQGCQWLDDERLLCAPWTGAKAGSGDPCEEQWNCDLGQYCVEAASYPGCAGAVGCCSLYCDVLDPAGDAECVALDPGMGCVAVFEAGSAPAGLEHLGVCALP